MNRLLSSWAMIALMVLTVPILNACRTDGVGERRDLAGQVNDNLRAANLDDVRADWREEEGELRLSGEVETADQRARAEEVASQVVGTTGRVVNEVRVEGVDTASLDNHIEERLEAMFEDRTGWAPLEVNRQRLDVDVEAGVVTLKGTVESQQVKDRIEERAREIEGVRDVVNHLEVEGQPQRGARTP